MSRLPLSFALAALVVAPFVARAECYVVYDAKNTTVYQGMVPPIDLSRPIGDEMARRYPGRHLTITSSSACVPIDQLSPAVVRAETANPAALLRATGTARYDGASFSGTSPAPTPAPGFVPTGSVPVDSGYGGYGYIPSRPVVGASIGPTAPGSLGTSPGTSSTPGPEAPASVRTN